MYWVFLALPPALATDLPPDTWGCVAGGTPPDSDGDGVRDDDEAPGDTDRDGCPDVSDPDDDGDGLPTALEDLNGNGNWFDDWEDLVHDAGEGPAFQSELDPLDNDNDGFLDANWEAFLTPLGVPADDCDDGYNVIHPGAEELYYNDFDEDCDGVVSFDQDGDGFDREQPGRPGDDCDDLNPAAYPLATEDDGPDDLDCDGYADPARDLEPRLGCGCGAPAGPLGLGAPVAAALALLRHRRRR